MDQSKLLQVFLKTFGGEKDRCNLYFAPGRVNLIGEHTDYNGGHVFPCALDIGTYGVIRKREDDKLRFYSMNFIKEGVYESSLSELVPNKEAGWSNYPKGMLYSFEKCGMRIQSGFDLLVWGNIPNASGLSSSASLEMLTGIMLQKEFGFRVSGGKLAEMGQYCEHNFNGVNCGIMDQFAVAMGKKDNAIYLDTNTLEYEYVPLKLDEIKIVIACSNKKRELADSKYNERRAECIHALYDLQNVCKIQSLGELSEAEFEQYKHSITEKVCIKRARHAVYENERTKYAVEILKQGKIEEFGKLMNESHISLRDDYEVTGIELDTLVEAAWDIEGVIGSRMTGAGFGGCTVSLVKDEAVDNFITKVGQIYLEKIGYPADFYVVNVGGGPRKI